MSRRRSSWGEVAFSGVEIVGSQGEARASLAKRAGAAVVVSRGERVRSALFFCPCTCGDVVVVNLDPASGDAWRARVVADHLTLMPSVWRTTGCRSHFIVWESRVWLFGGLSERELPEDVDVELRDEWLRIWMRGRSR